MATHSPQLDYAMLLLDHLDMQCRFLLPAADLYMSPYPRLPMWTWLHGPQQTVSKGNRPRPVYGVQEDSSQSRANDKWWQATASSHDQESGVDDKPSGNHRR